MRRELGRGTFRAGAWPDRCCCCCCCSPSTQGQVNATMLPRAPGGGLSPHLCARTVHQSVCPRVSGMPGKVSPCL